METHVSMLEVFNEMLRMREENMILRDENEKLRKREEKNFNKMLVPVTFVIEESDFRLCTREDLWRRVREQVSLELSSQVLDAMAVHRTFGKGDLEGGRAMHVKVWMQGIAEVTKP